MAGPACVPETISAPSASVATSTARFTAFWPPKRTDLVISPCSFANAMRLPLKDTEPMKPPTAAMAVCAMPPAPP